MVRNNVVNKEFSKLRHSVAGRSMSGMEKKVYSGSVGKHGSPLHTTTPKLQLICRTTIIQNCQKWKSYNYGIKKKQNKNIETGRRGGDVEQASPMLMCDR